MKKKQPKAQAPVVPKAILEQARSSASADRVPRVSKCRVCGSEVAPFSDDELCWVCRRLKISAWSESESQISAME